jgi:hypothetical protein
MLLLHLLYEAYNRSSPHRPHLCTLPATVQLPAFLSPTQLAKRAGPLRGVAELHARIHRTRQDMTTQYARLAPLLARHPDAFPPDRFSRAALAWAWAILQSRTWRAPGPANSSATHAPAPSPHPPSSALEAVAGSVRVLVPVADMANHAAGAPRALMRPGGDVVLWTTGGLRRGEELTISYGDKCPMDLFVHYGFLPPQAAAAAGSEGGGGEGDAGVDCGGDGGGGSGGNGTAAEPQPGRERAVPSSS